MSEFERLSRQGYKVDAVAKAAQQEADELGRDSFSPDALAKAAEQEEVERLEERSRRVQRRQVSHSLHGRHAAPAADETPASGEAPAPADEPVISGKDYANHTVLRRGDPYVPQAAASGGAVTSKRTGMAANLGARLRDRQTAERFRRRTSQRTQDAIDQGLQNAARSMRPAWKAPSAGRVLAIFAAVIVALYLVICLPIDRAISFSRQESAGLSKELSWHVPGMPYYVLALGSDAREDEDVSRTDTMILVRVDTLGGKLTMLSIPRDTMVEIEGYGTQKINAAYTFGGPAGAVAAVSKLTGAPISHVALIRFDGIESLVDYLGGVTVDVPVDVYDPEYTGLVLPAGEQWMDGNTAMLFSRVRHGFDYGDYQRQKNQRILITAIMKKALALPLWKMPGLVRHMGGMVGTTMRMYSILPLMLRLKLGGGATIYQATLPSEPADIDGISYVVADQEAVARMMEVVNSGGDPAELT